MSLPDFKEGAVSFGENLAECMPFKELGREIGEGVDGGRRQGEEPAKCGFRQRCGEGSAHEGIGDYVGVKQHVGVERGEVLLWI